MAVLVERATSDLLTGPDWGMNLEICDAINYNPSMSRDTVKALRKRLSNKSSRVQLLALMVLEMIMKNCGDPVHQMVAKDVLHDMVKIVKKKGDLAVRHKVLALLESWQKAFGGPLSKYSQYFTAYDGLRRSGVKFPPQGDADSTTVAAPTYTIVAANRTRSLPQLAYSFPEFSPAQLNDVLAASVEKSVWSTKDFDGARHTLEVLKEMLNALDPCDKQAIQDDVIAHLVEQCMTNQKIVMQVVNGTSDENTLCQGLALNDDIQQVLVKHSSLVTNALTSAELMPGSLSSGPTPSQGLAVYDNEDDEAEDEHLHLAHRSRSSCFKENGVRKYTSYTQWAPHSQPTSIATVRTVGGGSQNSDQGHGVMQGSFLAASLSGQATPSWKHQLSEEQEGMLNPFANTRSTTASSATSSASLQPSRTGKTCVSDQVCSSDLPSRKQDYAGQESEREKASHNPHTSFDDGMVNPTASWSKAPTKQQRVSGLPPPPSKYTERARFFEEQRQASPSLLTSSTSMDGRMQNLNLDTEEAAHTNGAAAREALRSRNKPVSAPNSTRADRLLDDSVDFRSVRSSYRAPGIISRVSRSKESDANGI